MQINQGDFRKPIIIEGNPKTRKAPAILRGFDDTGFRWRPEQYFRDALLTGLSDADIKGFIALRNSAYGKWMKYWNLASCRMQWQPIRIIKHQDSNAPFYKDKWFKQFVEGAFFVFMQPQTHFCHKTGKHYQYYLLSPEDSYIVNKALYEEHYGHSAVPKRASTFLPEHMEMSLPRMVPVELCHHMATHERYGGKSIDLKIKHEITPDEIKVSNES